MFEVMLFKGGKGEGINIPSGCEEGTFGAGPQVLIAGDSTSGFYGEISSECFANGDQLAAAVDLSQGTVFNNNTAWLKFSLDDKILLVPKKPLRYNVSWDHLNALGIVAGSKQITIGVHTYKIRLIRGSNQSPSTRPSPPNKYDAAQSNNSEWNRLFYPIVDKAGTSPEGIVYGKWAKYPTVEFGIQETLPTTGVLNWCQEMTTDVNVAVMRGYQGVNWFHGGHANSTDAGFGWRPVLELVE